MTKLMLNLVIDTPSGTKETMCRVYDRKSHKACDAAIRSGIFGTYSKSAYFLVGSHLLENGYWEPVIFPVYRKTPGNPPRQVLDVPSSLADVL